jgi:tetratricopeptide (TPR) repeat protein
MYEESLAIRRQIGDRTRLPGPLNNLALVAMVSGDLVQARIYLEECLAIDRELGNRLGMADTLGSLATVANKEGDIAQAARLQRESLEIRRDLGDRYSLAFSLADIAEIATVAGRYEVAARLYGAEEALREEIGAPYPEDGAAQHERAVSKLRAAMDPVLVASAWAAGRSLTIEEAVTEALVVVDEFGARAGSRVPS